MPLLNWFKGLTKTIPPQYLKVAIMKEMGWDYWTYRAQPIHVIRDLMKYNNAQAKAQEQKR